MSLHRRDILYLLGGAALSGALFAALGASPARALPRPPGSLEEGEFLEACTRCFQCIDVCPADALHPADLRDGIRNIGTPVLAWKRCILCMECLRSCPTGAIARVPKDEVDIGNAVIDRATCLAWSGQKACNICFRACRYGAVVLDDRKNPSVLEEKCNGCNACERRCPTKPKSIAVSYEKTRRARPPEGRFLTRLPDRMEPRHPEAPGFAEWFPERIRFLARHYGILKEE